MSDIIIGNAPIHKAPSIEEKHAKHAQAMSAKPDTRISDLQQRVKVLEEKVQALEVQMKKVNQ